MMLPDPEVRAVSIRCQLPCAQLGDYLLNSGTGRKPSKRCMSFPVDGRFCINLA
jgi:hypothetical protein